VVTPGWPASFVRIRSGRSGRRSRDRKAAPARGKYSPPARSGQPAQHALISQLALNGLRVSEPTGANIAAPGAERGHRTMVITRKRRQGHHHPSGTAAGRLTLLPASVAGADLPSRRSPARQARSRADRPPGSPSGGDHQARRAAYSAARIHYQFERARSCTARQADSLRSPDDNGRKAVTDRDLNVSANRRPAWLRVRGWLYPNPPITAKSVDGLADGRLLLMIGCGAQHGEQQNACRPAGQSTASRTPVHVDGRLTVPQRRPSGGCPLTSGTGRWLIGPREPYRARGASAPAAGRTAGPEGDARAAGRRRAPPAAGARRRAGVGLRRQRRGRGRARAGHRASAPGADAGRPRACGGDPSARQDRTTGSIWPTPGQPGSSTATSATSVRLAA